jgi:hypothetical protein
MASLDCMSRTSNLLKATVTELAGGHRPSTAMRAYVPTGRPKCSSSEGSRRLESLLSSRHPGILVRSIHTYRPDLEPSARA